MKLGHHILPIANFFITKNYLPVFIVFIITLHAFSQTNEQEQGIYNPIQNTEYANKYSDLKYDKYPYKSEPIKEQKQTTNINDFWFLNNFSGEFVWTIFIIVLIIIIYFLIKSNSFGLFTSRNKISENKILDAEKYIDELDFDYLINQALLKNDREQAVRFYFLKFLKNLATKEYITWEIQKTNYDYYYEIKNTALKKDFEYASYLYNYVWFGKFKLTDEQFTNAQKHFTLILKNEYYYS